MFQRIVPLSCEEGRQTGGCDVTGHRLPLRLNSTGEFSRVKGGGSKYLNRLCTLLLLLPIHIST